MYSQIQTQYITRKYQPLSMHGLHQTAKKRERIGNPCTDSENILSRI